VAADSLRFGLLTDGDGSDLERRRVLSELSLFRSGVAPHENISRLLDVSADRRGNLYVVYELMPRSLQSVINHPKWNLVRAAASVEPSASPESPVTVDCTMLFVYQLLCAVKWLHGLGLVHGGIQPSNVLVNDDCDIKLAGFHHHQFAAFPRSAAAAASAAVGGPGSPVLKPRHRDGRETRDTGDTEEDRDGGGQEGTAAAAAAAAAAAGQSGEQQGGGEPSLSEEYGPRRFQVRSFPSPSSLSSACRSFPPPLPPLSPALACLN
jgi:hypothetical protein